MSDNTTCNGDLVSFILFYEIFIYTCIRNDSEMSFDLLCPNDLGDRDMGACTNKFINELPAKKG